MTRKLFILTPLAVLAAIQLPAAEPPTAENAFSVKLPPHRFAAELLPDSPFGINTAFDPETPDRPARLNAMEEAGIKWGRQDFTWRKIEREIPKPYAYIRVNVTEKGIDVIDIFGTKRRVTFDPVRTKSLPVPLGESPIYITGPKGLKAQIRPDPGW